MLDVFISNPQQNISSVGRSKDNVSGDHRLSVFIIVS